MKRVVVWWLTIAALFVSTKADGSSDGAAIAGPIVFLIICCCCYWYWYRKLCACLRGERDVHNDNQNINVIQNQGVPAQPTQVIIQQTIPMPMPMIPPQQNTQFYQEQPRAPVPPPPFVHSAQPPFVPSAQPHFVPSAPPPLY